MMRESLKLKRVLVSIMVVLMMAAYMPGMAFAEEGGGGEPSIAEADWNFDAATGTLKGFKEGKNFNNPASNMMFSFAFNHLLKRKQIFIIFAISYRFGIKNYLCHLV